ncbi:polyA polymerase family protein [Treponema primitia ZAS-2]|uniref:PolyA polymerase family protein n=1 Tax=Treponema primitia (strain ATCC BAA-887 / DSM 12427 / ZAS-2) TaxID=545694 RepID=F5YMT3_TREPZ|nr:polynucleotide adenylyltransferase PcnB [Treponema primitia]AEF84014.1 polyA polymerase family protein [Treponema primitia ZAS-2]
MRIRYGAEQDGKPVKKAIVYTQNEHGINFSDVDSDAVNITSRLRANGFETYIVGGAVRDLMLGKKPKDFDIVSDATPSRIKKIFRNARVIGRRFRLVHVYFGPKIFEVCTFRSLKDGPTSNTYGTIEEDVLRRDFSLNALFYDPGKQVVVDYVGGMKDIREKRIRPIIPLSFIFKDDPVRMIRAVKYAATTGFKLPLTLRWTIKKQAHLLAPISPSRLTEEIFKILHSPSAAVITESLESFGLYEYLQPNLSRLMKENELFRSRYLKGLSDLNQDGEAKPGEAMAALIRDYLTDFVDWDAGLTENYKIAFLAARQFVLPMNPPRIELDQAVRLIFNEHGQTIKKKRLFERGKPRMAEREAVVEADFPGPLVPAAALSPSAEPMRKRRRRHRSRSNTAPKPDSGNSGE